MSEPVDPYRLIADRAFGWIVENRDQFRLPPIDSPLFPRLLKPLGELALTAGLVRRSCRDTRRISRDAEELLTLCWDELQGGRLLVAAVRDEPALLSLAAIYQPLRDAGLRYAPFERALRTLAEMPSIARLEYPPWRQLELAVALRALGVPSPWDADSAYAGTWLAGRPEPWMLNNEAAYSLTHTVFYRTDFGRFPDLVPVADHDYLVQWLPVWFEYYAEIDDFDIATELIIVARSIGAPDVNGWGRRLLAHQAENGMVPGPSAGGASLDPTATDPRRTRFLSNYHTTLVAVIAAVLSL